MITVQRLIFLLTMMIGLQANAIGRLQDADFKTLTQITNAGGTAASLLNDSKIYVSANGINQTLNSAIGSGLIGGGAGVNLVSNGTFEASGIAGWSTFQTTLTGTLPTGPIATCATCSLAISANTASPLNGKASLQLVGASNITAGQGFISAPFTVSPAYRGQVLSIKGLNSLVSGAPIISGDSTGTFAIYAYDVTNSAWIQPAGAFGIVASAGPFAPGSFQVPANTSSMRLAVVAINTLATPATLLFDDLTVAPGTSTVGPALTDWKTYTPTLFGGSTGNRIVNIARWRQVGQEMELHIQVFQNSAGSTGTYTLSLPNGYQIDTALMPLGRSTYCGAFKGSGAFNFVGHAYPANSTSIGVVYQTNSGGVQNYQTTDWGVDQVGTLANASYGYSIVAKVPIVGWSSNVQQSSDFDGRATTFVGSVTTNQSLTANTTNVNLTAAKDSAGAWNGSGYVVPVAGDYRISGNIVAGTVVHSMLAYVDGVSTRTLGLSVPNTNSAYPLNATLINLRANQIISFRADGNVTAQSSGNVITIERVSGAQPIQLAPSYSLRYTNSSGQSIAANTNVTITGWSKVKDSGNAFNPVSGVFTAPVSGTYQINVRAGVSGATTGDCMLSMAPAATPTQPVANGSRPTNTTGLCASNYVDAYYMNQGEQYTFYFYQSSGATRSLIAGAADNYLSIVRTGN